MPAVVNNQYLLAEAQSKASGFVVPVGAVLWVSVSAEARPRLSENLDQPFELAPNEWRSGDIGWLVVVVGDSRVINLMLKQLQETVLKRWLLKSSSGQGQARQGKWSEHIRQARRRPPPTPPPSYEGRLKAVPQGGDAHSTRYMFIRDVDQVRHDEIQHRSHRLAPRIGVSAALARALAGQGVKVALASPPPVISMRSSTPSAPAPSPAMRAGAPRSRSCSSISTSALAAPEIVIYNASFRNRSPLVELHLLCILRNRSPSPPLAGFWWPSGCVPDATQAARRYLSTRASASVKGDAQSCRSP